MGLMKHLRSISKGKTKDKSQYNNAAYHYPVQPGLDYIGRLPENVLRKVFGYVCPHTLDESYESCEDADIPDGCLLCDLRDLSNCAQTRRGWYGVAAGLLYRSVRIDAVHYCELEQILQQKRKKNRDDSDPPSVRLKLFTRTVRENQKLADAVQFLKLPYMTREGSKADLARAVSVLPNLRYVDLPEGFFTDDPQCITLRQEVYARCRNIRKMKYDAGSEQSFESLWNGTWRQLEVLDVSRLQLEGSLFCNVLASLPALQELSVSDIPWFNDAIFKPSAGVSAFPPLRKLSLTRLPSVTSRGLSEYFSRPEVREVFCQLVLEETGVRIDALHSFLWGASNLSYLSIKETVSTSLPMEPLPPLSSISLKTLHFEVTSSNKNASQLHPPAASYYNYLRTSLMSNSLPGLRKLYVRDPEFPESLTLAPPVAAFMGDEKPNLPRGFSQPLEVYSKAVDEHEWIYTSVLPSDSHGRRGSLSGGRPLSSYSATKGLGPQWGGDARKSTIVGNGFGGFLAVPADDYDDRRPRSAGAPMVGGQIRQAAGEKVGRSSWFATGGAERRSSRQDLWR